MIPELPSNQFTWELYCSTKGFSNIELLNEYSDSVKNCHKLIGYAKADNLPVRPRPGRFALMIETECGEKNMVSFQYQSEHYG